MRTFTRSSRILRSAEFRLVYDQGFRVSSPLFAAFCRARPDSGAASGAAGGPRLGLTLPRAVGGAVVRNRIKRRIREAFRLHREGLGAQWDIVLNPRRAAERAPFQELVRALRKVIDRCNS